MGKGVGWDVVSELILYASFTLVPLALPLAVLIASIMTMGNLGERFELVSMKAAGVSLTRAMASLVLASIFMGMTAFYFSNTVMPYSKLRFNNLLWDVQKKKSVLLIREGVFINDFDNMTMKIDSKHEDESLHGVTIYDHRQAGTTRVIKADSARIIQSDTSHFLTMHLMDGKMHEDKQSKNSYTRFGFKEMDLMVDMSSFEMSKTDADLFKNNASLKTLGQISTDKDTLQIELKHAQDQTVDLVSANFKWFNHEKNPIPPIEENRVDTTYQKRIDKSPVLAYENAVSRMQAIQSQLDATERLQEFKKKDIVKHEIAWYQKFALAFSCVILFFIGAPMGALVRKGGFGLPILISIGFYLLYYVIDIIGKRLSEEQVFAPIFGIWLSSIVLVPIAFLLTRMAILDRKVNLKISPKLFNWKKGKELSKK